MIHTLQQYEPDQTIFRQTMMMMSPTCVKDGHMEKHALQSWMCEYPV